MRVFFIENRYKVEISLPKGLIEKLPERIMLFSTVQYLDLIEDVKAQLEKKGKIVLGRKAQHSKYDFQVLGCGIERFDDNFDAFLFVGDGMFHPKALVVKNDKPCFFYNPLSQAYGTVSEKDAELFEKRRKGAIAKFISSENIGVLISTKPGQKASLSLVSQLEEMFPEKRFYLLLSNEINPESLMNFPFAEAFVNTACPRIAYDEQEKFFRPVVNAEDIIEFSNLSKAMR